LATELAGVAKAAYGWARRWRRPLAVALAGLAAGAGLAWGNHAYVVSKLPTSCGSGCVTDGSLPISTDSTTMQNVENEIAKANTGVRSSGQYDTVVLLDPFTYSAGGTVSESRMTAELAGAYLAQQTANKQRAGGPEIQLLLANEGTSAEEGAPQAVARILALQGPDRITAVAGMGLSVAATQTAAMTLAGGHLPMFGAVTTADEFNGVNLPGFYQAVPDVESQVQALLTAVPPPAGQRITLIDSDQPSDIYSAFLNTDFTTALLPTADLKALPFNPASAPAVAGQNFANDASSVCNQGRSKTATKEDHVAGKKNEPPLIVLFAGRAASLPALIQVFQQSAACANLNVTILTGSDANDLPLSATLGSGAAGANVTVEYADIEDVSDLSSAFTRDYTTLVLKPGSPKNKPKNTPACKNQLYDPWAVATYNSVMAAATVRVVASPASATTPTPTPPISGANAPTRFSFLPSGQLDLTTPIPLYQDSDGGCTPAPASPQS
jgi:hypothetical protein